MTTPPSRSTRIRLALRVLAQASVLIALAVGLYLLAGFAVAVVLLVLLVVGA